MPPYNPPIPSLLSPPTNITPQTALTLSQKSPLLLTRNPTSSLPWPISLLTSTETPSTWTIHENAFYASLRTGDDASARQLLTRLTARFGETNERILTLRGVYEEAVAKNNSELEQVLKRYERQIKEDPTMFPIRKRRVAVLKALGRTQDAMAALVELVEQSPADVEAWAELGDGYMGMGLWAQAVFCWEEVLLVCPNAWAAHAHIAGIHYLSSPPSSPSLPALTLSLHHYTRSLELNPSYLRAHYGLKLLTQRLIPVLQNPSTSTSSNKRNAQAASDDSEDIAPPRLSTVQKLEEIATSKLAEIVRRYGAGEKGWTGYDEAEVIAARELLDRDGKGIVR
jgi:tetratricopeptide (TPR) repeat protein